MIWKPLGCRHCCWSRRPAAAVDATGGCNEPRARAALPGTVETQEVRLSSRVGGRVAKVLVERRRRSVEPGSRSWSWRCRSWTPSGQQLVAQMAAAEAVLAKAENGPREEEKAAAKAAVDAAAARLARMQKGYRKEEKEQASSEQQALEAELQNARQELNRERTLLTQGRFDDGSSTMRRSARVQPAAGAGQLRPPPRRR